VFFFFSSIPNLHLYLKMRLYNNVLYVKACGLLFTTEALYNKVPYVLHMVHRGQVFSTNQSSLSLLCLIGYMCTDLCQYSTSDTLLYGNEGLGAGVEHSGTYSV